MQSSFDLYQMLVHGKNRISANMIYPWSPGHSMGELDNLLRMIHLGEVPQDAVYLAAVAEHPVTQTVAELFAPQLAPNVLYIPGNQLFLWSREIALSCPDLVVDPSIGHTRYGTPNLEQYGEYRLFPFQNLLHRYFTNKLVIRSEVEWRRRRMQSLDYNPLRNVPDIGDDLIQFMGGKCDKIALVHIRTSLEANVAVKSAPSQMYPTLEYLRDTGHTILFASRETFPEEFAQFGVLNYAQSPVASFRNDLLLFKAAKMAIVSGAGIGCLAQIMGTPLVWANSWGQSIPFSGPATVWLPARVEEVASGRVMSFPEQLDLFHDRPNGWNIPAGPNNPLYGNTWGLADRPDLAIRHADADDMLAAVQECLSLSQNWVPRSALQDRYSAMRPEDSGLPFMEARISDSFIRKYQDAL